MKPELGVCYYPEHWPEEIWAEDAQRMVDTGLEWVRIGEFAWGRIEAKEGEFTWDWLDKAIEVLGGAGLKIILGTPTATPPKWVLTKYPDMIAVDENGNPRKFGSRRHYCFSHLDYRKEAAKIAGAFAKRYGNNPYIHAWQIDNEYGCHNTVLSYSDAALSEFRIWLAKKYQSTEALNKAWGNVFWSLEYANFEEVDLPNLLVTEANPTHILDFKRFSSDQVIGFNKAQIAAMRRHTNGDFLHNYMGKITEFDHFELGKDLEIASWDSYPLGFLEQGLGAQNDAFKTKYMHQGDPDFQAFHHDLYRSVGRGRWWVMEQQPGPVNWAPYNPIPHNGMVKLWTMEAIAHGAEVVSYFRWRQVPFAQEQMHSGLLRADSQNAQAQIEVMQVAKELKELGEINHQQADVAMIFDYESQWAWEAQPQSESFDYFQLVFEQYRALRKLGLSIDILAADTSDFGTRKLVLIPGLLAWTPKLKLALKKFKGVVLAGPRTGSKNSDLHINIPLGPEIADTIVSRVGSLRPNAELSLVNGGAAINWIEQIEANQVVETSKDGMSILSKDENHYYLAAWLDEKGHGQILEGLCEHAGVDVVHMPSGVRMRNMGAKRLLTNYNNLEMVFGDTVISPTSYLLENV